MSQECRNARICGLCFALRGLRYLDCAIIYGAMQVVAGKRCKQSAFMRSRQNVIAKNLW